MNGTYLTRISWTYHIVPDIVRITKLHYFQAMGVMCCADPRVFLAERPDDVASSAGAQLSRSHGA